MERTVLILGVVILAAVIAFIGFNVWSNPVEARSQDFALRLANAKPVDVVFEKPNWEFERWQDAIAAKPSLWKELVAPPPPPPPPPKKAPHVAALLKGVQPTRQQVGDKVRIIQPGDSRGSFMGVGDTINGVTIREITRTEVNFVMEWEGQELPHTIPRQ